MKEHKCKVILTWEAIYDVIDFADYIEDAHEVHVLRVLRKESEWEK